MVSAYSIGCLLSPFPAISRRFVIRARVGDDIHDLCGLLIALATLDALCWIMSLIVSLMASSSYNVLNWLCWNSIFFYPIRVASILSHQFFISSYSSCLMLLTTSMWSLPELTWLMTVTSVTISGLFIRM